MPMVLTKDERAAEQAKISSFSSTSTMDSDYEIPSVFHDMNSWTSKRVSEKLSSYLSSIGSMHESEAIRKSVILANKWKKQGYHPYKPDSQGYTALHRAAKKGDPNVISSLLAMFDDRPIELVQMKSTKQGQLALHIAARHGRAEAVRILATPEFRTLINARDKNDNTALHFAVTCNRVRDAVDTVSVLLLRGANPVLKNRSGIFPVTAHLITTPQDDPEIIYLLLKHGCDPNTQDSAGNTLLHIAVSRGLWKIAACLIHQQASMHIPNNESFMVMDMLTPNQLSWLARYIMHPPRWLPSENYAFCMVCQKRFNLFVRRHHCRLCGRVCCSACSKYKRHLPFQEVSHRVQVSRMKANQLNRVCGTCIRVRPAREDDCQWNKMTAASNLRATEKLLSSEIVVEYEQYQ